MCPCQMTRAWPRPLPWWRSDEPWPPNHRCRGFCTYGFEKIIGINYYLFHEAIIMFSFYLIGSSAIKCNHIKDLNFNKSLIYSLLGVLVIYFTYNLNQGPFRYLDAVVILLSGHGQIGRASCRERV